MDHSGIPPAGRGVLLQHNVTGFGTYAGNNSAGYTSIRHSSASRSGRSRKITGACLLRVFGYHLRQLIRHIGAGPGNRTILAGERCMNDERASSGICGTRRVAGGKCTPEKRAINALMDHVEREQCPEFRLQHFQTAILLEDQVSKRTAGQGISLLEKENIAGRCGIPRNVSAAWPTSRGWHRDFRGSPAQLFKREVQRHLRLCGGGNAAGKPRRPDSWRICRPGAFRTAAESPEIGGQYFLLPWHPQGQLR